MARWQYTVLTVVAALILMSVTLGVIFYAQVAEPAPNQPGPVAAEPPSNDCCR